MPTPLPDLYETDVYARTRAQARALRRPKAERIGVPLDFDRLASEVRDSGTEWLFAVRSRLVRLLVHLVKLEGSSAEPPRRPWPISVASARDEIEARPTPTLRRKLATMLAQGLRCRRPPGRARPRGPGRNEGRRPDSADLP